MSANRFFSFLSFFGFCWSDSLNAWTSSLPCAGAAQNAVAASSRSRALEQAAGADDELCARELSVVSAPRALGQLCRLLHGGVGLSTDWIKHHVSCISKADACCRAAEKPNRAARHRDFFSLRPSPRLKCCASWLTSKQPRYASLWKGKLCANSSFLCFF